MKIRKHFINKKPLNGLQAMSLFLSWLIFWQTALAGYSHQTKRSIVSVSVVAFNSKLEAPFFSGATTILLEPQLPSGPDQPEALSFTPVEASDMVNPFTGDFSYNIPLLDVDGYPINLAYNAGANMDEEATWVGLGWNLNPGVINRNMRGIPDEFNGENIERHHKVKDEWTIGGSFGADFELFGFPIPGKSEKGFGTQYKADGSLTGNAMSLNFKLGINWNNYNGFGAEISVLPSFNAFGKNEKYSAGLGISGSSTAGPTLSPSFNISHYENTGTEALLKSSGGISVPINSRTGVRDISINFSKHNKWNSEKRKSKEHEVINSGYASSTGGSSFNLGQSTYFPSAGMPMKTRGLTFSFKLGLDAAGFDPSLSISGYYSKRSLKDTYRSTKAYGYAYLHKGQKDKEALLDFNRENDGAFTKFTPALPIPSLTYDLFSITGQGMSGNYRMQRTDIGYVFDPEEKSTSLSGSAGYETNLGANTKNGIDLAGTGGDQKSGVWDEEDGHNIAVYDMYYRDSTYYFREANEMSVSPNQEIFDYIGGTKPVRFDNNGVESLKNRLLDDAQNPQEKQNDFTRRHPEKQNQVVSVITREEYLKGFGVEQDLNINAHLTLSEAAKTHPAEITCTDQSGKRYVYGRPAYNRTYYEQSFSVANDLKVTPFLTGYANGADDTPFNTSGTDHYFDQTITPNFVHSWMLTSVLGSDYMDVDDVKGPSAGDKGFYVKFCYNDILSYAWRSPREKLQAHRSEGLFSDPGDDKGSITHGVKDLYYVEIIRTKNYVVKFFTSDRLDAKSNGNSGPAMQKLDSILLYSAREYDRVLTGAEVIKAVHFRYNYSLCANYPESEGGGKLTLRSLFFTYKKSRRGQYTPYIFDYQTNSSYNRERIDRWGNYSQSTETVMDASQYPYSGFNRANADSDAANWNLSKITLPSGGSIEIFYESDDYGYVQNRQAMSMFPIGGVDRSSGQNTSYEFSGDSRLSDDNVENAALLVELPPGYEGYDATEFFKGMHGPIYVKASMSFGDGRYEYVPCFVKLHSTDPLLNKISQNGKTYLRVKLEPVNLKEDESTGKYNPIAASAIHFGRLHLSKFLPPSNQESMEDGSDWYDFGNALWGAFQSFGELFTGPNKALYNKHIGTDMEVGKAFIRLNNPSGSKLGGGHRVKEIRIYDTWDGNSDNTSQSYYGQKYSYVLENGKSSGVASYEPMIGGDENPFKEPVYYEEKNLLAPDRRNYQLAPFGEAYFPSASVGYSRVVVEDLFPAQVSRHATGKVVHEFYTAKEFPTIVKRTHIDDDAIKRFKSPSLGYFFSASIDEMSASQGFYIENNDMHGKTKAQYIYAQDKTEAISKVEYFYQMKTISAGNTSANVLENEVQVIRPDGKVSNQTIGVIFEAVADFRRSVSNMYGGSVNGNINFTAPVIIVPSIIPTGSYERTAFHSATFTKVVERFGILDRVVASDLGSVVETKNLAYDSETGAVLLTETINDFNDPIYSFTYPAHWYYDGMGQAYHNLGKKHEGSFAFEDGICKDLTAKHGFFPGDEVGLVIQADDAVAFPDPILAYCWVVEATPDHIHLISKEGFNLNTVYCKVTEIKIVRSGRRNLQGTPIGTITLKTNPLNSLKGNVFNQVLDAAAIEFRDNWRTDCNCEPGTEIGMPTTNPYVLGIKGQWRPSTNYTHLTTRSQAFKSGNSNIRQDGIYTSYSPFYKLKNGKWYIDRLNWTYVSSVVEFNPNGLPLETVDALNRYSSTRYGFNNTLQMAVAANTRYRELGSNGFDDPSQKACEEVFPQIQANERSMDFAHTGFYSLKINNDERAVLPQAGPSCDLPACDLLSNITPQSDAYRIEAIKGTAPYHYEYEIIYGGENLDDPQFSADGSALTLSGSGAWKVRVTVTDDKGCSFTKEIVKQ